MPGKNLEKIYSEDTFYHVYNRGINKDRIFRDKENYKVFLNLFKRYLSDTPSKDKSGREYPWLKNDIELLTYCLMPNHFHLLIYQYELDGMTNLLKALMSSYGMYFNKKYERHGPVFQNRFRATAVGSDSYLYHISRYIHLNPGKDYTGWDFSGLPYVLGKQRAEWIKPQKITDLFDTVKEYKQFLSDYQDYKESLDEIGPELANS